MNFYNDFESRKVNIRVEYESTPIRHLAIQCPSCEKWFNGCDIILKDFRYEYELINSECICPICAFNFRIDEKEEENLMGSDVYKDVYRLKTEWVQE